MCSPEQATSSMYGSDLTNTHRRDVTSSPLSDIRRSGAGAYAVAGTRATTKHPPKAAHWRSGDLPASLYAPAGGGLP